MGSCSQSHGGRSNQEISGASWHHTVWKAGGNRRSDELSDIPEAKWLTGASVRMDGGEIKGI
jgi:hypothetical protein